MTPVGRPSASSVVSHGDAVAAVAAPAAASVAGEGTTLLEHIAERRGAMRPSEAKVADVILADPVGAIEFNMAGLADAADVSEPTVMRFCGAVGLDGFRSFKIALAQTVAIGLPSTHSAILRSDGAKELTEKIFDHSISSLDRSRRRLDPHVIEQAIDRLAAASDLLFVGFGASGIIAQDAQQKFPLFGVPCQAPADHHQQFIAASMSRPTSVTVAISHTGATRETIRVAEAAKVAGGTVISITGENGPLSGISDLDIRISTFEDTDFTTPSVSRLAGLVVIDILATGVTLRRSESELQRIAVMKERLAEMRSETD